MTSPVTFDSKPSASHAIEHMIQLLPEANAGMMCSATAALIHNKPHAWGDLDIFMYSDLELVRTTEFMLSQGWEFSTDQDMRKWQRWMKWGLMNFKTNTLHLNNRQWDVNLTYKTFEGHPVRTIGNLAEGFDFSHLIYGYDFRTQQWYDFRSTYIPNKSWKKSWFMPERELRWMSGSITEYQGLRQVTRYYKNQVTYEYDMSPTKPVLVKGYEIASAYHLHSHSPDKQSLGVIYDRLAEAVEHDDWATIQQVEQALPVYSDFDDFLRRID